MTAMDDLVAVVARAICRQSNLDDGYRDNATLRKSIEMGMWRNHSSQARAALAAIEAAGYGITTLDPEFDDWDAAPKIGGAG